MLVAIIQFFNCWKLCKDEGHCGILVLRRGRGEYKGFATCDWESHQSNTYAWLCVGGFSQITNSYYCYLLLLFKKKLSKRGTWMCILTRFHTNKTNDRRRAQQKQQRNSCRCKIQQFFLKLAQRVKTIYKHRFPCWIIVYLGNSGFKIME